MDQDGNVEIWDFTITDPPKRFRLDPPPDGEVFEAPPLIGGHTLVALVKGARKIQADLQAGDEDALMTGINQLFGELLTEDSAPKFIERISDRKRPVDLKRQLLPVLYKLMEAYGLRPTQEPTASSSTSAGDGTSSTDGAPPSESTPSETSTPDASST